MLRIQPLRTPRDENVYECVAQNSVGEITVHAKLTVLRGTGFPVWVGRRWALGFGVKRRKHLWTSRFGFSLWEALLSLL